MKQMKQTITNNLRRLSPFGGRGACCALLCFCLLFPGCQKDDDGPSEPERITYTYRQARSEKRGISCNSMYVADFEVLKTGVSWFYNWGISFNNTLNSAVAAAGIDFCPMAWNGLNADALRNYVAQHPDCQYLLAYNEPNLTDQANMTPAKAAELWPALKATATELGLKVVSPAMNYGTLAGYSDPIDWLDEFFTLVPLSDIDAIAIHCYMSSPASVKSFVERFRKYGKPIWMTEFCAWENNPTRDKQREYLCDVINYFEADPLVGRYAWFKYDENPNKAPYYALRPNGNTKGELTELGQIYAAISSFDKTTAYPAGDIVPAEHYSNTNLSDVVGTTSWAGSVQLKLCSDSLGGILEVTNFGLPKWLEYRVQGAATQLTVRYAAVIASKCKVKVGSTEVELALPATGGYSSWETLTVPLALPAGQQPQTVRFTMSSGMISLNWWKLQ
jgi:hypothetical protein